jgi:hypothetical protein
MMHLGLANHKVAYLTASYHYSFWAPIGLRVVCITLKLLASHVYTSMQLLVTGFRVVRSSYRDSDFCLRTTKVKLLLRSGGIYKLVGELLVV